MPLPKCVKVDKHDSASRTSLEGEGWRYVGTLMTYVGEPHAVLRHLVNPVEECTGEDVVPIAQDINWSGRFWRDPYISKQQAWAETKRFLQEENICFFRVSHDAFIARTQDTIKLIGVIPSACGKGLGEILIRATTDGLTWAGTYEDNLSAQRLYEKLYFRCENRQAVFHK